MKLEEIVPEYYSKNPLVRNLFFKRLKIAFNLAKAELKVGGDLKVVDLGCGAGDFLLMIEKEFKNIKTFGVDIEPNIEKLKDFLRAEIKVADIKDTKFSDNFFNIVFCLDVLEHFEDLDKPIREIRRIVKPGGLLVVSLPTENLLYKIGRFLIKGTTSMDSGPYSPHFYNAKAIERFLISKGFKLVKKIKLLKFLPLFYIASFEKNN